MADASHSARPEFAALEQADWHRLEHGPAVIYLLAHARRETFYIDLADNLEGIRKDWGLIAMRQKATLPESCVMPPLLVWFETAVDQPSAQARLKQIRAFPHPWQRRLVDTLNPAWVDLYAYSKHYPLETMPAVGERQTLYRDLAG